LNFVEESQKVCPCREDSSVIEVLGKLARGEGSHGDIEILAISHRDGFLVVWLGQSACIPVMDSLKYFRSDYENRINQSLYLKRLSVS
jgi:NADH:ubiquinone oxidoreductase subunit F (NADH-binding)